MRPYHLLIELLFPRKCMLCRCLLSREETDLCRDCRSTTPEWHSPGKSYPSIDDVVSVWYYDASVRDSLLRYKFSGCRHYAKPYARLLSMAILRGLPEGEVITWVPVSPLRRLKRGYDQSELLARAVGAELGLPVVRLLKKTRNNRAQSGIEDPALRRTNVRGVYQTLSSGEIRGKRIILLDDILTTGATAGECARILRKAGAKQVSLAVMASGRHK